MEKARSGHPNLCQLLAPVTTQLTQTIVAMRKGDVGERDWTASAYRFASRKQGDDRY